MPERSFDARLRPWVPAVLWLVVIACESSGIFTSEHTAQWLWTIVTGLFGAVNRHEFQIAHGILRKVGHFTGYAILSYFFFIGLRGRYLSKLNLSRADLRAAGGRLWRARWALLAIGMTVAVAALDEFHQTMIPGRTGVFHDVVLDGIGGVFAQGVVLLANPLRRTPASTEEGPACTSGSPAARGEQQHGS